MMTISIRTLGHGALAIAGLMALAVAIGPARAEDGEGSTVIVEESRSVEVETVEQRERRTVEVETMEIERLEVETVELEATSTSQVIFSEAVQMAIFEAIAQDTRVSVSRLQVVSVHQRQWSDGCLGLNLNQMCTQAIVPGYQVTVTDGQQFWVYRTNLTGTVVYLDEAATEFRMAQVRARTTQIAFPDVVSTYWAAQYIRELAALDILAGYPDGLYRPDAPVTRAEFAAIIRRAFRVAEVRDAVSFTDVESNYWARVAIEEAYEMGFLDTANGNQFRPLARLLRAEALTAIARGLRISTDEAAVALLSNYSDVTVSSSEARLLLAALTQQGIMVNYPNARELNLERAATRAEVAVLVYQALYSLGYVEAIASPYVAPSQTAVNLTTAPTSTVSPRQNCNQGIGNGPEGCDPGNSAPRGGSNDETGRRPN